MLARRLLTLAAVTGSAPLSRAFAPVMRTLVTRSMPLAMAAPGVVLDSTDDIKSALSNPNTVIVDTRRIDEIQANGYFAGQDQQWVHAPCTVDGDCPLLAVAGDSLLRDKSAPVIVYCASGKRAAVAQNFLKERGYTTVLNAGGFPGDFESLL